jgi:hypothetical protein
VSFRSGFLARDPDERTLRWGWVFWFSWLLVGGALLLGDFRGGVGTIGMVLAAPFWALWLLWALYRGLRVLMRLLLSAGLSRWSGQYFEFDGRQIRIVFDGDDVFFSADDVFEALGTGASARDPERVRQVTGRDGLRLLAESGLLCFSEKGLAAWLDRRTDPTAAKFARWVEMQVLRPYRRRLELGLSEQPEQGSDTTSR